MRKDQGAVARHHNLPLILVTYAIAFVLDFVMEACILLPIGPLHLPRRDPIVVVQRRHLLPMADL